MCNQGTDPGRTGMFPLINRVRAANKAAELSHESWPQPFHLAHNKHHLTNKN